MPQPIALIDRCLSLIKETEQPMTPRQVYDALVGSMTRMPSPYAIKDALDHLEAQGHLERARTAEGPYAYCWPGYPWANWPLRRLKGEPGPERRHAVPRAVLLGNEPDIKEVRVIEKTMLYGAKGKQENRGLAEDLGITLDLPGSDNPAATRSVPARHTMIDESKLALEPPTTSRLSIENLDDKLGTLRSLAEILTGDIADDLNAIGRDLEAAAGRSNS